MPKKPGAASFKAQPETILVFALDSVSSSALRNVMKNNTAHRFFIVSCYNGEGQAADLTLVTHVAAAAEFSPTRLMRKAIATASALAQGRDVPTVVEFPINVSDPVSHSGGRQGTCPAVEQRRGSRKGEEVGLHAQVPGGNTAVADRLRSYGGRSDMCDSQYEFGERERRNVNVLIAQALAEDLGQKGDITSAAIIPSHARGSARLGGAVGRGFWPE